MFERWTERLRRAVVLAQEETRIGCYPAIDTGQLLLGLIHEGEGVAFKVLDSFGVDLEHTKEYVRVRESAPLPAPLGSVPFTMDAKQSFELALREALQLGVNYVGTEHLLLGLIAQGHGLACEVLVQDFNLDLADIRRAVITLLSSYVTPASPPSPLPEEWLTEDEHRAMELSGELATLIHRIIGDGPVAISDWAEAAGHIHSVQRNILAQAAARLYPDRYRLLGQRISE